MDNTIQEIRKYITGLEGDNGTIFLNNRAERLLDSALGIIEEQQKEVNYLREVNSINSTVNQTMNEKLNRYEKALKEIEKCGFHYAVGLAQKALS
jgi:uncharacterized protein (DUF1015 family)